MAKIEKRKLSMEGIAFRSDSGWVCDSMDSSGLPILTLIRQTECIQGLHSVLDLMLPEKGAVSIFAFHQRIHNLRRIQKVGETKQGKEKLPYKTAGNCYWKYLD